MKNDFLTLAFRRIRARFIREGDRGDDNDDALQEAFCRLWNRRVSIENMSHAEGLLITTTRNIRIDCRRSQMQHQEIRLSDINDPPDSDADDEISEIYGKVTAMAAEHLSERDREILYKRDRDGMKFSDIAAEYGLSEGNVRLIISRARKTIRELYLNTNK